MEPGARTLIEQAHQCLDKTLTWRSQLGTASNIQLMEFFARAYHGTKDVSGYVAGWQTLERDLWGSVSTTVLAPDVVDTVRQAAGSMPEAPVLAEIVPSATGVVIMPDDGMILDYINPVDAEAGAESMPVQAIAWQVVPEVGRTDPITREVTYRPGVVLWLYSSSSNWAYQLSEQHRRSGFIYLDVLPWAFGTGWKAREVMRTDGRFNTPEFDGDDQLTDPHVAFVRRFMLALWTFMTDDIVVTSTESLPRPLERRAKREGAPAELRITHLRRVRYIDDRGVEHDPGSREFSHRFLVRGHWRHLASGRVTWVRPHLKGPADKPFIMKSDVDIVRR